MEDNICVSRIGSSEPTVLFEGKETKVSSNQMK
jgi:hypothetical protein